MAKVAAAPPAIAVSLSNPGMSALHRAGLAGLWMSLESIESDPEMATALRETGAEWQRTETGVVIQPGPNWKKFLELLVGFSFRLTDDGRLWFLALGHPDEHQDRGVMLQDALLQTFEQHGRTRGAEKGVTGAAVVSIEDEQLLLPYRRLSWYSHMKRADALDLTGLTTVNGWLLPGATQRHIAFGETSLRERPALALALWFAPVGSLYLKINRRTAGVRPQFCLAVPAFSSLSAYADARRYFLHRPVNEFVAAGTAEAAARVLATLAAANLLEGTGLARCDVVSFGVVPWNSQQKTRVDVFEVQADGRQLRALGAAIALHPAVRTIRDLPAANAAKGVGATADANATRVEWRVSPVLDLVTRNVVAGKPWWRGFGDLSADKDQRTQFEVYEFSLWRATRNTQGGIRGMVKQPGNFATDEEIFVSACHEAWHRTLGRLGQRERECGEPFRDLVRRERERYRVGLTHCKNAAVLRATVTDFWSRAGGSLPPLQTGWREVLPLFSNSRWEEARDLALLALASYEGAHGDEGDEEPADADPDGQEN